MKFHKRDIVEIIILIIAVLALIIFWKPILRISTDIELVREVILKFGFLSSIAFIIFTMIQVIIPPIPGQIAGLVGGYVYGVSLGTFYSIIGLIVGTYIIVAVSRKFGEPLVEKFVKKERMNKLDKKFQKTGSLALFLFFLIPVFPDDIMSYILGLTKMSIKKILILSTIARIPKYLAFNIIGNGLYLKNLTLVISLAVILVIISVVLYICKDKLNEWILSINHHTNSKRIKRAR
ncbi:MAG: TVP38/TMEM64 family protein [Nanoarchaeota archaeon]